MHPTGMHHTMYHIVSGDATLHTTPTAPNKQELEPSRVNVSKKSDVADMEATELMAANILVTDSSIT